jgi:tRNA pseudouridine38-40 synthase
MRNIALLIEYDGTAYSGWQVQKNGHSIQGAIEKALSGILQENIKIVGASRTDAGVHASGQVANFLTRTEWGVEKIVHALNSTLPRDIAVSRGTVVPNGFHSRFDAVARKYVYRIVTRRSALERNLAACFHYDLSLGLMNEAAAFLVGEKSFKSFTKYADQQRHFVCKVRRAEWSAGIGWTISDADPEWSVPGFRFVIESNRFLHGMVRAIVGTLIDVGRGKISVEEFEEIVLLQKRSFASMSAPACGLWLAEVKYSSDLWKGE